jgi:glycine/D-amino acid oxidase-like deaminating enzyme
MIRARGFSPPPPGLAVNEASSKRSPEPNRQRVDVTVIGDGVIGLSTALELARAGADCVLIGTHHDGAASTAAAGLLAPNIGPLPPNVRGLYTASFDLYPEFVERLREFDRGLSILEGLLEVFDPAAPPPPASASVNEEASAERLSAEKLLAMEPALSAPVGGVLHRRDGAIDNVRLVRALRQAVDASERVRVLAASPAAAIEVGPASVTIRTSAEDRIQAGFVVIAAGAWSAAILGLPRKLPVFPLKGQMLAFGARPIHQAVMANRFYLVPRETETVVGSTAEDVGFETSTTPEAVKRLRQSAAALCPALGSAPLLRAWAGLRPATPDMLPIIGADPEAGRVLYACGHSKNGILLAPATARAITALAQNQQTDLDLSPFSISRFG